jgi:hypothetical protein
VRRVAVPLLVSMALVLAIAVALAGR